jgi:hypothetical protein
MQQRHVDSGLRVATRHPGWTSAVLLGLVLVGERAPASEGSVRSDGAEELTGSLMTSSPTASDAATQTLLARERAVVNAWKDRDGKRMAELFGPTLQFVHIFGNHIATRAEALKAWSGEGCDVKGFELEGAKATMFSPDVGVLTYRADYDAKCFGQDVWPIWGSAFYVRHGDAWLWSSGINVLAGAAAP